MKRLKRIAVSLSVIIVLNLIAMAVLDVTFSKREFTAESYDGYYYLTLDETEKQAYTAVKKEYRYLLSMNEYNPFQTNYIPSRKLHTFHPMRQIPPGGSGH